MENVVLIDFIGQVVFINKKDFRFSFSKDLMKNLPSDVDVDLIEEVWWNIDPKGTILLKGSIGIPFGEEHYDDYVKPYVDLWYAEKDRVEQEQQQALEEYAKFANRQERALTKITEDYDTVLERGFVRTSLGFDADISCNSSATLLGTQTSLAYTMRTLADGAETPKTIFRDFYGLKRELDAVQVERLICEINGAQNHIREQKYLFKGRVKDETSDNESLNAVLEDCVYSTLDFSNLDEAGNPAEIQFNETKSIAERIDAPYM